MLFFSVMAKRANSKFPLKSGRLPQKQTKSLKP